MNRLLGMFLGAAFASGLAGLARAETLVLQPGLAGYQGMTDNSIYEDYPANTNGGHAWFYAGNTKLGHPRRALLRFDLSPLPAGALITAAELRVTVNRAADGATNEETHTLHRLLSDWGEGTLDSRIVDPESDGGSGAPAAPGDATWTANFFGVSDWTAPGADFAPAASGSAGVGGVVGVPPNVTEAQAFFSGAGMAADLQFWLENPAMNFGWAMLGNESANKTARRMYSSEWEEADATKKAARLPRLTITFDPPNAVPGWELYE